MLRLGRERPDQREGKEGKSAIRRGKSVYAVKRGGLHGLEIEEEPWEEGCTEG